MSNWEWEIFKYYINGEHCSISQSNCLSSPIESLVIKRDKNLDLIIETKCKPGVEKISVSYPPGTVCQSIDNAVLKNLSGNLINISGIIMSGWKTDTVLHEYASIHKIFSQIKKESEGEYLIEWLVNVDNKYYMWPDLIDEEVESTHRRIFSKDKIALTLETRKKSRGGYRGCVNFSVDGYELYLGVCKDIELEEQKMPGFILYKLKSSSSRNNYKEIFSSTRNYS